MRRDVVVFAGPTLSREEASRYLDACYLPPADQGAIVYIASEIKPEVIVLIDGVFGHVPSVRHKEILWALSRGMRVCGAASLGAIRAAELHPQGMIGHGLIYRRYRATPLVDDDEVAVAMSPVEMGSQAIGDALINMRITLRAAARQGVISASLAKLLVQTAQATYFLDRSYSKVIADVRPKICREDVGALAALERWLKGNAIDQKRADAIGLLRLVASGDEKLWAPRTPERFDVTLSWLRDLETSGLDTAKILDTLD
jgi:hypothetical protein